jgi:predicted amidohydrolase
VTCIFKTAAIQLELNDKENRLDRFLRVEKHLEEIYAKEINPAVVLLPEIWATGFFNFDRYTAESEPLRGETYARLAPWAEKLSCYFLAGSIIEREEDRYYNTSLLIAPDGSLAGRYRKMHLFGYQSKESEILTSGSDIFTLKTDFGTWGVTTCYDLRFPELYRKMMEEGVEMLFVVAAWPLARLEHWILFNRVRALENLCYLVSCNCAGLLKGSILGGNSMAVDPWGEIIARAGDSEEMLVAEHDPGKVAAIRSQFPALEDRKIIDQV